MSNADSIGAPFRGVIPALVTPLRDDGALCTTKLANLTHRMLHAGCTGTVWPGSLGEGQTLSFDERVEGWRTIARASARCSRWSMVNCKPPSPMRVA